MSMINLQGNWYQISNVHFDADGYVAAFKLNDSTYVLRRPDIHDPEQWVRTLTSAGGAAGLTLMLVNPVAALFGGVAGAIAYLLKNAESEGYYEVGKAGSIGRKFDVPGVKRRSSRFQE